MELLGLDRAELQNALRELGEPAYRGRQLAEWFYRHGVDSLDAMTNLGLPLRERLRQVHSLTFPVITDRRQSRDGSVKLLLKMLDGETIETVLLPYSERVSVCVSSQAGCAMACAFCATGLGGFRRNLSVAEIIAQPLLAMQQTAATGRRVDHVVFMGMGEPLLNYANVIKSVHLMHDELGVPMRHITISTVGIVAAMRRLADEKLQLTLAVSLHAPDDDLRRRLIPTAIKTTVADIVEASKFYVSSTGRRVTFQYVVLGGVNDTQRQAHRLAGLCKGWPCHVNLIPWNAVPDASWEGETFVSPAPEALRAFRDILENAGVAVTQRQQRGADVAAACGQLRAARL